MLHCPIVGRILAVNIFKEAVTVDPSYPTTDGPIIPHHFIAQARYPHGLQARKNKEQADSGGSMFF